MDLDSLKKEWNNSQPTLPSISDDKLLAIFKNKALTALNKLLLFEVFGFVMLLLVGVYYGSGSMSKLFSEAIYARYLFLFFCFIGLFWQIYKIYVVRKVDIRNNDLLTSSRYILKYKQCLRIELLISLVFLAVFMTLLFYPVMHKLPDSRLPLLYLLLIAWGVFVGVTTTLVYNRFYKRQIGKIETSLEEIKEFEKDND